MHKAKFWTFIWFCMGSTASDKRLELWALAAPVSLLQGTGTVVACQSSTVNLELRAGAVVSAALD